MARTLDQLVFNNSFSQLPASFYTAVTPQPLNDPFLVSFNPRVCQLLELNTKDVATDRFAQIFTGNLPHPSFTPLAMKYTGHQFGQYNPDLGDGRGVLLGEVVTSSGAKWDLHLKGSDLHPIRVRVTDAQCYVQVLESTLLARQWQGLALKPPML